ncbi:MAG: endonuclease III domain-containing protein [Candidatus Micrarchaeia archaeon]
MACTNGKLVFRRLSGAYTVKPINFVSQYLFDKYHDAFKVLVATILSQNSSDKSALSIFNDLDREIGVNPENLHSAAEEKLQRIMKRAGLYRSKSKYIKSVSDAIAAEGIDLRKKFEELGPEGSRKFLTSFLGVGEKTADVVLLTVMGYPFFPVDRHVARVGTRLGITLPNDSYGTKSHKIARLFSKQSYLRAHQLLITHGRETCKAVNPRCAGCVLNSCCDYYAALKVGKIYK